MRQENIVKKLTEDNLTRIVRNVINESINNENDETHFAIHRPSNKIAFGWDYSDYDSAELKQFKKDYFSVDLREFFPTIPLKEFAIWTRRSCIKNGLDPNNQDSWMK